MKFLHWAWPIAAYIGGSWFALYASLKLAQERREAKKFVEEMKKTFGYRPGEMEDR
jgi:hypothetical protein